MNIKAIIALIFAMLVTSSPSYCEDNYLGKLFSGRKLNGTMVIINLEGKEYVHNDQRANTPFSPASTFMIPNTLIALEEGVISENEILKWDGKERRFPPWNKDLSLEIAFMTSCDWFYQELARRIGTTKYQTYLTRINYGNALPKPNLTTFWKEGDLKINAMQQVEFMKRIYRRELPFKAKSYDILKKVMFQEKSKNFSIMGKGELGNQVYPYISWFVGYVETKSDVWFFATNMTISRKDDDYSTIEILLEALKQKGIIRY